MKKRVTAFLIVLCCVFSAVPCHAEIKGKIDVGAAYVGSDIINCDVKVKDLSMRGLAGNGTISLYKAFVLKPSFALAGGDDEDYWSVGMGAGLYIPITDSISVLPSAGGTTSELNFRTDINPALLDIKQIMATDSGVVGLDVTWQALEYITISAGVQYAWVRTRTYTELVVFPCGASRTSSSGWNQQGQIDYWLSDSFSINVAVVHLHSRSNEKHGSDSLGYRCGVGVRF